MFCVQKHLILFRSSLLVGFGLFSIFGANRADWSGAGPLAVLTLAFVAAYRWRHEYKNGLNVRSLQGIFHFVLMAYLHFR
jgi:hypothetical protein